MKFEDTPILPHVICLKYLSFGRGKPGLHRGAMEGPKMLAGSMVALSLDYELTLIDVVNFHEYFKTRNYGSVVWQILDFSLREGKNFC